MYQARFQKFPKMKGPLSPGGNENEAGARMSRCPLVNGNAGDGKGKERRQASGERKIKGKVGGGVTWRRRGRSSAFP